MKKLIIPVAGLALAGLVAGCSDDAPTAVDLEDEPSAPALAASLYPGTGVPATTRTYEITLENLTPATGPGASQVFSPPVIATHGRSIRMFREGRKAMEELAQIAEDANNGPMLDLLNGSGRVHEALEGGGVIPPGQSASWTVHTVAGSRRLSMAFMLVNTNDGFSGTDAIRLPRHGEETYYLHGYDAGSEENTELAAHIPGPCCGHLFAGVPTDERISMHPGILGVGDLDPDTYGWDGPVAKLTVRRLAPAYDVTLENLTPATVPGGSQVFSPPVLATHRGPVKMFRVGGHASEELAAIAEDGMTGPMVQLLSGHDAVWAVETGGGPIPPDGTDTYRIESAPGFHKLSMAFMLVNTNDAFSGLDRLPLPRGGSASYYLDTYDAGSEENTELEIHIPGPCCGAPGAGIDTDERIRHHAGILGTGDLDPAEYGWDDPSAKVTITRVQ